MSSGESVAAVLNAGGVRQSLTMVAIVVRDYEEALNFYVGTLGFELVEDTPRASAHS